jgi:hypothetical protein
MRKDLLLKVADHMDSVDPKNYNQRSWFAPSGDKISFDPNAKSKIDPYYQAVCAPPEGFCNSASCVLGHAASVEGTDLKIYGYAAGNHFIVEHVDEHGKATLDFRAAAKAFDIPQSHANVLFGPPSHPPTYRFYTGKTEWSDDFKDHVTPSIVAKRIRSYVRDQRRMDRIAGGE